MQILVESVGPWVYGLILRAQAYMQPLESQVPEPYSLLQKPTTQRRKTPEDAFAGLKDFTVPVCRGLWLQLLRCWVHKPQKVYSFSFIVGNIIPKSVRCIHSATKIE